MTLPRLRRKDERRISRHASVALIVAAFFLPCIYASPASALTIGLTRFGGCGVTPGACKVAVDDNGAGDLNSAVGTITFSEIVGVFPDGVFTATGTLIENIARDASGRPVAIRMTLTDAVVQGAGGGIQTPPFGPLTLGQLLAISSEPLSSPFGVAGYASLLGAYEGFGDGFIGFSDISLEARLGGLLLGRVDPAAAIGVPAPVLFGLRLEELELAGEQLALWGLQIRRRAWRRLHAAGERRGVCRGHPGAGDAGALRLRTADAGRAAAQARLKPAGKASATGLDRGRPDVSGRGQDARNHVQESRKLTPMAAVECSNARDVRPARWI